MCVYEEFSYLYYYYYFNAEFSSYFLIIHKTLVANTELRNCSDSTCSVHNGTGFSEMTPENYPTPSHF